ncbi:MAG: SWIM zinc finger family protein [Agitococcus sp.]
MDMPQITPEQALQYAPDDSSLKAAKKLAPANQWQQLHLHQSDDNLAILWGEIRGSALYQSAILLSDKFVFHCNCPSFKRPCKHSLALLICYAQSQNLFKTQQATPDWLNKHIEKHQTSQAKKQEKAAAPAKIVDEAAQAKRAAAREQKVNAATAELQQWLVDLLRTGLAQAKTLSYSHFERIKSRLVDGQASGLVSMVEDLQSALAHQDWQQRAAVQIGKIQLILAAYQRIEQLPTPLQADVRSIIGWTTAQEQVLANSEAAQDWLIVGNRELEGVNGLRYRRQWLWHKQQNKAALVLQFAAGFQPLAPAWPNKHLFSAEVAWYPSAWPQRIVIKSQTPLQLASTTTTGFSHIEQALEHQAQALAHNPFLAIFPMLLQQVVPHYDNGQLWLIDQQQQALPFQVLNKTWPLLALSAGHPICVFGEWDGYVLTGLSAWTENEVISL